MSKGLPKVSSISSDLNDFTETAEGEKIYNVKLSICVRIISMNFRIVVINRFRNQDS